jgi:PPK2 family polyphosphate:nucleotide phosphotransferase
MRKEFERVLDRYRVTEGKRFRLKDHDPDDTAGYDMEKAEAAGLLAEGVERLAALQDRLYAQDRWAMLAVLQAMDAAGKDGTIKHVMSGVNPQGVHVTAFKAPGPEELDHDFLWRVNRALPERGRIGIFNRSHYEEVLVVRVHPQLLQKQRLPDELNGRKIWQHRLDDIAAFERYLSRQGTIILKFFLNVSRKEQKRRFMERIDDPAKNWKFNAADISERAQWKEYMAAYEEAIAATAAPHAPWFVVPADNKWFTRLIVCGAMVQALERLDLEYPPVTEEQKAALEQARKALGEE